MDLKMLHDELENDPLTRGYAGMSDANAAVSLNIINRTIHKTSMSGSEVLQNVVDSEYNALTAEKRSDFWGLLGIGSLDPWGKEADVMINIFGLASATITALGAARVSTVSRGIELGLGNIQPGDVTAARAYGSV